MANGLPSFLVNPAEDSQVTPVNHPTVPANSHPFNGIQNPFFQASPQPQPAVVQVTQTPEQQPVQQVVQQMPVISGPETVPIQYANTNAFPVMQTEYQQPQVPALTSQPSPMVNAPQAVVMPAPQFTQQPQQFVRNPNMDLTLDLEKLKIQEEQKLEELKQQQAALQEEKRQIDEEKKQNDERKKLEDAKAQQAQTQPTPTPTPVQQINEMQPNHSQQPPLVDIKETFRKLGEEQARQAELHKDPIVNERSKPSSDLEENLLTPGEENEYDLESRHAKFEDLYKQLEATDISSLSEFSQERVRKILEKFRTKIDAARKATTEVEAIARIASGVRLILRAQRAAEALDAIVNTKDEKTEENLSDANDAQHKDDTSAEEKTNADITPQPAETPQDATPDESKDAKEPTDPPESTVSEPSENTALTPEKVEELLSPLNSAPGEDKKAE